jgi:periplasmic protein TonB
MASTLLERPAAPTRKPEPSLDVPVAPPPRRALPHFFVPTGAPTANERMQQAWGSYVAIGVAVAAAAHFAFISTASFDAMPDLSIRSGPPLEQLTIEQPYELPPPPEAIARPAVPVLSTNVHIDPDITIGSTLLRDNPTTELPPPPTPTGVDIAQQPTFTPYEVRPELRNGGEIQRVLEQRYPSRYKEAGIGGNAILWVFIDESGAVRNTRIVESSGYPELDELAQSVLRETARFSPAYNRDTRVRVWIQIPISFQTFNP